MPLDRKWPLGRANAFYALSKLDKALADCNRAIEIDNRYFSAFCLRRNVYSALGETKKVQADDKMIEELLAEDS